LQVAQDPLATTYSFISVTQQVYPPNEILPLDHVVWRHFRCKLFTMVTSWKAGRNAYSPSIFG